MIKRLKSDNLMLYSLCFTCIFGFFTLSMFLHHLYMILNNESVIESSSLYRKNPFNFGKRANWEQIFGANKWLWPLPVSPDQTISGVEYPIHE